MSMASIRILLADDHANVRDQIRNRLSREPDLEIVGEARHSTQAMELAAQTTPDVVLIDPIMRDGRGLVAVAQIAQQLPQVTIIVLTAFADTALQMELKRIGIRCILDKGIQSEQLIETVHQYGHNHPHQPPAD